MKSYVIDKCPGCGTTLRQRTTEQNALLHAVLADIAEQKDWAGRKWDVEAWKRILTSAFCRANGQSAEIIPAIDGHGIEVLYRHTSRMSKQEMSELIEFITAQALEWGVKLHIPEEA